MRRWFKDYDVPIDLRHKKEEREAIEEIIRSKHANITTLEFGDVAAYKWQVSDIYYHLLSYWQ